MSSASEWKFLCSFLDNRKSDCFLTVNELAHSITIVVMEKKLKVTLPRACNVHKTISRLRCVQVLHSPLHHAVERQVSENILSLRSGY